MNRFGSVHDRRDRETKAQRRKISSQLTVERRCYSPSAVAGCGPPQISQTPVVPSCASSPSDMKQRHKLRGSVRRDQYGTVELVVSIDQGGKIKNIGRFRVEPGPDVDYGMEASATLSQSPVIVENPQTETRWYWKYYLGNEHQNFAGIDPHTKSPFFMSIMIEDEADGNKMCRAILWTSSGPRRLCIATPYPSKVLTAKGILQRFPGMSDFNRGLKEIINAKAQRDLVVLEDQEGCVNCKFGVIFALDNQISDAEMLSNEHGNEDFDRFLKLLGQRIELHGWGSYRGGLDTTTNSTGRESVYTAFANHEIMFHVSTLLPYSKENRQQIERKRHVGNDIVNLVFEAGGDPVHPNFSPTMMKSHFTHVFALVTYQQSRGCYRLWVFSEETVPAFGPSLPHPSEFYDPVQFREFLLTKLINAEKAAFQAKVFVEKRHRTNDTLLKDMYMEYLKDCQTSFHKVTDTVIRHLRSPIKKEAPKEAIDFCKLGELVKLEKMLSGEISESGKIAALCRKQPWEPELIFPGALSWEHISSDSWGNSSLLLATDDTGVIFINEGLSVPVIEQNARVQQLAALEHFGLFIARCDKGKESCLSVFALADLRLAIQSGNLILKKTCMDHRILTTKGCHLFGTSDPNGLRLNIVICIGKRLMLLRWAFGPLGRIHAGSDLTRNFTELQGLTLNDEPVAVSVFEKGTPHGTVKAVLATKHHLIIADFGSHTHRIVYSLNDIPKGTLSCISGAVDGDVDEIVFAYDNITVLIELHDDGTSTMQETFWTSNVNSVVCRFPFVVGFGHDIIEVRLAINGNLLSSMYKPGAKLLAAKDDIIFAAEKMTLPVPTCAEKNDRPVLRPSMTKRQHGDSAHKRWDLYRISAKNLQTNGVEQRERQDSAMGGLTPQLLRNPQSMAARLRREVGRDGSTASDSGFSSRGYPSGAEGSIDASMPNSPMCFGCDPFAEPEP